ncbi:MAG: dihydrolipoamide acetyltransferase family protein, partial [Xanthomonadales bacterium]|nr:dihydrolipoamide acetyltransferase family protein [Xanthomonadales bacterium]
MSEYVFKLPDLGEGTVESEIAEWMVKVGDEVDEEDPICSMLTDKAAVELSAPVSGRVKALAGELGDVISVGAPLITFEVNGAGAAERSSAEPEPQTEAPAPSDTAAKAKGSPPGSTPVNGKVMTSPSIRRRAREAGVDLTEVAGSGPRGRILKTDFEAFLDGAGAATQAPRASDRPDAQQAAAPPRLAREGTTEIKVVGLRRKIAERMDQANREVPHFAYVEEIDVTALEDLRQHLNARKGSDEVRLTPLPFLAMALVRVLSDFPQCNAHYDKDRGVITRHNAVHLGIATQTDDGLKVPVVRNAEARSLEDMAAEIRRVTQAARDNSAKREELTGSTITITSLGKLGGIVSTPIINLPEVGIIGVNKAVER